MFIILKGHNEFLPHSPILYTSFTFSERREDTTVSREKKSIFKKKWQVVKIWEGRKRCQLNGLGEHTQRTVKEEKQV